MLGKHRCQRERFPRNDPQSGEHLRTHPHGVPMCMRDYFEFIITPPCPRMIPNLSPSESRERSSSDSSPVQWTCSSQRRVGRARSRPFITDTAHLALSLPPISCRQHRREAFGDSDLPKGCVLLGKAGIDMGNTNISCCHTIQSSQLQSP